MMKVSDINFINLIHIKPKYAFHIIRYKDIDGKIKETSAYIPELDDNNIHSITRRNNITYISYRSNPNKYFKTDLIFDTVSNLIHFNKRKLKLQYQYDKLQAILDNFDTNPKCLIWLVESLGYTELRLELRFLRYDFPCMIKTDFHGKLFNLAIKAGYAVYDPERKLSERSELLKSSKSKRHMLFTVLQRHG